MNPDNRRVKKQPCRITVKKQSRDLKIRINYNCPSCYVFLARHECKQLYHTKRVLEYDFRIIVPTLNGYFRIAYERKDIRRKQLFPANLLHFYSDGSITPDVPE